MKFIIKHKWISFYILLLVISNLLNLFSDNAKQPHDYLTIDDQLIHFEWLNKKSENQPLLIIHGMPGNASQLSNFATAVSRNRPVINVDLPGLGGSKPMIQDPTFEWHADLLLKLMKKLEYESFHVAGFSLGGGTAITMAKDTSVSTLSLISSIGIQSHELAGDYMINHGIHGLQVSLAFLFKWFTPHFGLIGFNDFYTSSLHFFNSDQRPIKDILTSLEKPAFILHGNNDILVSINAAKEHARLLKNSQSIFIDKNHFYLFGDQVEPYADYLENFLSSVEKETFTPEAIDPTIYPYRPDGFSLIVLMIIILFSTFVSEDLACFSAGLLVSKGTISFLNATLASFAGILIGDVGLVLLGAFVGQNLIHRRPFKWIVNKKRLKKAEAWLEKEGAKVIFISRFTPGTRGPTYLMCGVLRIPITKFLFYFVLASLLWTPILVGASYLFGNIALDYFGSFAKNAIWILIGGLLLFRILNDVLVPSFSWKGRRMLYGKWIRMRNWEFWPAWFFNIPLVLFLIRLAIKYKSPTKMTAANPGIPMGGVVNESKYDILNGFTDKSHIAPTLFLHHHETELKKTELIEDFLNENNTNYPIVIKPDKGERGKGVFIIKKKEDLKEAFEESDYDVIVQPFIPGDEFGVLYVRKPDEKEGFIYSLTEKKLTAVVGDGKRNLEKLILKNERTLPYAKLYLDNYSNRLDEVPEKNVIVPLAKIGTHSRGATFLNAEKHITPELTKQIDRISKHREGFFIGRYDVKVPTVDQLRAGQDITVLELNGITSEPTHMYHPKTPLSKGYSILFNYWKMVYEIGHQNVKHHGIKPASLKHSISEILKYFRH